MSLHDSQNTSSVCNYVIASDLEKHAEESIPFCTLAEAQHITTVLVQSPASGAALSTLTKQCKHRQQNPNFFTRPQHLEALWSEATLLAPVPSLKCFCTTSSPWHHFLLLHVSENLSNGLLYDFLTRTSVTGFQSPPLKQMRIVTSSIHTRP